MQIVQKWLDLLCRQVPNIESAIVVNLDLHTPDTPILPIAEWPSSRIDINRFIAILPLLKTKRGPVISTESSNDPEPLTLAASPIVLPNRESGAVILEIRLANSQQSSLLQILGWSNQWLQLFQELSGSERLGKHVEPGSMEQHTPFADTQRLLSVLQANDESEFWQMLADLVATTWHSPQVFVGKGDAAKIEICALSNCKTFDKRRQPLLDIQSLMAVVAKKEEAITISHGTSRTKEMQDHSFGYQENLLGQYPGSDICAMPFRVAGSNIAVFVILFQSSDTEKTHDDKASFRLFLETLEPLWELFSQTRMSIFARLRAQLIREWKNLFLERSRLRTIVSVSVVVLVSLAFSVSGTHRVRADATLEGRIQRAIVAPFDGYIKETFARAGEEVQEGDLVAQMEDNPLQIERLKWLSQQDEYKKQYRQELSVLNHSQAQIAQAKLAQAEAQIQLMEEKVKRSSLLSPLSGLIVSGDLSRSLGSPVEKGDILFEVAPLDEYRVALKIEEKDIAFVETGQLGELLLSSYPNHAIRFQLDRISSIYSQDEKQNWYRAEARLFPSDFMLRPGMEGVAKIDAGDRSYFWIWCHKAMDKFNLWLWSWTP